MSPLSANKASRLVGSTTVHHPLDIRNTLAEWINEQIVLRINQLVLEETVGSIFLKLTPSLPHPDFTVGLRRALDTSRSVRIVTHINNEISSSHIKNVKRDCFNFNNTFI